jgi:hypothetical protein
MCIGAVFQLVQIMNLQQLRFSWSEISVLRESCWYYCCHNHVNINLLYARASRKSRLWIVLCNNDTLLQARAWTEVPFSSVEFSACLSTLSTLGLRVHIPLETRCFPLLHWNTLLVIIISIITIIIIVISISFRLYLDNCIDTSAPSNFFKLFWAHLIIFWAHLIHILGAPDPYFWCIVIRL